MTKENRGLASSDEETRERVTREGGKASHGGGRKCYFKRGNLYRR
jgi:hypothetical protein